jgi:hypothetical protein
MSGAEEAGWRPHELAPSDLLASPKFTGAFTDDVPECAAERP